MKFPHFVPGLTAQPPVCTSLPLAQRAPISDKPHSDNRRQPMRARIYQPSRNAMQSGVAKTKTWILDYGQASSRDIDPLMGWTASGDTQSQVRLSFDSKEAALAYAEAHGIEVTVSEPNSRKPIVRAGGYGENFATNRRVPWTH
jgi:NADH dehydrogenase ubiquinone Fe-S protein 4